MNNILKDWEWKYRVFFDRNIEMNVKKFIEQLNLEEQKIMNSQLSFYKSFFTIDTLIIALRNKKLDSDKTIEHAIKNIKKCSKTEKTIYEILKNEINFESNIINDKVLSILDYSLKTEFRPTYNDYLKLIFKNSDYNNIINLITSKADSKVDLSDDEIFNINKNNIEAVSCEIIKSLIENNKLIDFYGKFNNDLFNTVYKEGMGYGEWWDKDLYDEYLEDTLILYKSKNEINYNDLLYTIIHEVYPGHGHFFRSIKQSNKNIDTGAFLLIEGYATYSEVNTIQSKYALELEKKYAETVLDALNLNFNKLNDNMIREINQKIGYVESYYFGCFAIEYYIKNKFNSANNFLDFLNNNSKGEFFKLW